MCGELPDVANAEAALQGLHPPFPPGTNISYSCHNGYISNISGTTYAICMADNETAEWSFEPFYCKSTCTTLPEVPHAELELEDRTPPFPSETTITFVCDLGFVSDLRVLQVICREARNGSAFWDQPSYACKPRSCGFPGDIENSHRIGNVFSYPNNVTYVCNEGFRLRGIGTIYCMTTGVWRPDPPSCEAVICPLLPHPEHGKVISSERRFGSTATYECDRGFRLEGSTHRFCQTDGMWSNSMPLCTEITCPHPGQLINGRIVNDKDVFKSGELIIFACNDGQRVSSKCLESGVWHKRPPLCRACNDIPQVPHAELRLQGQTPPFQLGTAITFDCVSGFVTDLRVRQITCHENEDGDAVWDELPHACKAKGCNYPGDVPNARRVGNIFAYPNNVTYVCKEGFKLNGPGTIHCMTTGIWRPHLPSCEGKSTTLERIRSGTTPGELKCSHPGPLENGKFDIGEDSVIPHLLFYTCNDGTRGRIKCSEDGTWNTQPKCPGTTVHHLTDHITKTNSTLKEVSTTPLQITDATTKIPDDQKDAATTTDHQNTVTMTNTEQYSVTTTNKEHNSVTTTNKEHNIVTTTHQKQHIVTTTHQKQHIVTTHQEHHSVTTTHQESKKVTQNEVESTTGNGSGLINPPSLLCLSFSWLSYYFAKLLFNHFCEYPHHYSRKS